MGNPAAQKKYFLHPAVAKRSKCQVQHPGKFSFQIALSILKHDFTVREGASPIPSVVKLLFGSIVCCARIFWFLVSEKSAHWQTDDSRTSLRGGHGTLLNIKMANYSTTTHRHQRHTAFTKDKDGRYVHFTFHTGCK